VTWSRGGAVTRWCGGAVHLAQVSRLLFSFCTHWRFRVFPRMLCSLLSLNARPLVSPLFHPCFIPWGFGGFVSDRRFYVSDQGFSMFQPCTPCFRSVFQPRLLFHLCTSLCHISPNFWVFKPSCSSLFKLDSSSLTCLLNLSRCESQTWSYLSTEHGMGKDSRISGDSGVNISRIRR
jgi:hypothetical protein